MNKKLPPEQDTERLKQLPTEELVEIIIRQAIAIEQLHKTIEELIPISKKIVTIK